jgi:predicted LPLAT superfamily acyltransferase
VPSWSGKSRGKKTGYKIFVLTIKHLGLPFAYLILKFVVLYYLIFSRKSVRTTYKYAHHRLKFSFLKSVRLIIRNYYIFGQTLIDRIALMAGFKTKLTFNFDGENYLQEMENNKTAGILISAHIGNFEIAGHLLKRLNVKANLLMVDAEHQRIKDFLGSIFKDIDVNIITVKNDFTHIFEIKKALEDKEIVCMLGDRFLDGTKKLSAKFLGEEAFFPAGPFYMATKYNVPIIFVFGMKERKYHYHFYASPPKYYYQPGLNIKNRDSSIEAVLHDYLQLFEEMLKKYPEQFFNYYDFWEEGKGKVEVGSAK